MLAFLILVISVFTIVFSAYTRVRVGGSGETKCPGCAYDLSGLPLVGVCPECGLEYDGTKSFVPPRWEFCWTLRRSFVLTAMCPSFALGPLLCTLAWYGLARHSHISPELAWRFAFDGANRYYDSGDDFASAVFPYFLWMLFVAATLKRVGRVRPQQIAIAIFGTVVGQAIAILLTWSDDALSWITDGDALQAPVLHSVCFLGIAGGAGAVGLFTSITSVIQRARSPRKNDRRSEAHSSAITPPTTSER